MTSQQNNDTNTTSEPNWMKEDCVQSIPKEKLHFLQKLVFESSSLSQKELLPFLMALAQKSREASISFSDTEISSILMAIRKYATPEEQLKMNQIVRLMAKKMPGMPERYSCFSSFRAFVWQHRPRKAVLSRDSGAVLLRPFAAADLAERPLTEKSALA